MTTEVDICLVSSSSDDDEIAEIFHVSSDDDDEIGSVSSSSDEHVVKKLSLQQPRVSTARPGVFSDGNRKRASQTEMEKKDKASASKIIKMKRLSDGNEENKATEEDETKNYWLLYPGLCASLELEAPNYSTMKIKDMKQHVKKMIIGLGKEMATELEDEWKVVHEMELGLKVETSRLINKQAQAMMEALSKTFHT